MSDFHQTEGRDGADPRPARRLVPTGVVPVRLLAPPAEALWSTLDEMSVRGLAVTTPAHQFGRFSVEQVVEVQAGAAEGGELRAPARVVSANLIDRQSARLELEFIHVAGLSRDLERFFLAHFDRRQSQRSAPLVRDVIRAQAQWPGGQLTARVHDLSASGMALSISTLSVLVLPAGEVLALRFRLPGAVRSIAGQGTVCYTSELPRQRLIGVAFDLHDPQGIVRDLPQIEAFVAENAARDRAWEQGWVARGA